MPVTNPINNTPNDDGLWSGLGGHFDNFSQVICEFVDNSVSNIIQKNLSQKTIQISLEESNGNVKVKIEDTGAGITDLDRAFSLGSKDETAPSLNEHGFGLKHALATADKSNRNWAIYTRTRDLADENSFAEMTAKYLINNYFSKTFTTNEKDWPGDFHGTGTIIQFEASKDLFQSLSKGIPGNTTRFRSLIKIFCEDLGFYYSGIIENGKASIVIKIIEENGNIENMTVPALTPDYIQPYPPANGTEDIDLGDGLVTIKYGFGKIKPKSGAKRYYKANMSSSGVEIQLNGRVIESNLFKEIWSTEKHNSYNSLLVRINVISENKRSLPTTRTSKNGLRMEDEKTNALFEWVRTKMPSPKKDHSQTTNERSLFEDLKAQKETHLASFNPFVSLEQDVFTAINDSVRIDFYLNYNNNTYIYEGKRDRTTIQDIYQLKMYWDGCVLDGITPTQGILIASEHPRTVPQLIEIINDFEDQRGNKYNFISKTWRDEGVEYPT